MDLVCLAGWFRLEDVSVASWEAECSSVGFYYVFSIVFLCVIKFTHYCALLHLAYLSVNQ